MSSFRSKGAFKVAAIAGLSVALLSSCTTLRNMKDDLPFTKNKSQAQAVKSGKAARAVDAVPNLGVNAFLWRASLETLNFMPADQTDPFGGVIITDWYSNPELPSERFKATAYILDTQLRADALKVAVFKQENKGGTWVDASTDADTARKIENAILTRARELYIASN